MTPEQAELADKNRKLVPFCVGNYLKTLRYKGAIDPDDLRGAGYIGLCKAATSYQPGRGTTFATYACRSIGWAIQKAAEAEMSHNLNVSYDPHLNDPFNHPLDKWMKPLIPADPNVTAVMRHFTAEKIHAATAHLSPEQVTALYWTPETRKERLPRSLQQKREHLRRATIKTLRRALNPADFL